MSAALTPRMVAEPLRERGRMPCEALALALRRRKSDVRRVLGENPDWFLRTGSKRWTLWALSPHADPEPNDPVEPPGTSDGRTEIAGATDPDVALLTKLVAHPDLYRQCLKAADGDPGEAIVLAVRAHEIFAGHLEERRKYGVRKLDDNPIGALFWGPRAQWPSGGLAEHAA